MRVKETIIAVFAVLVVVLLGVNAVVVWVAIEERPGFRESAAFGLMDTAALIREAMGASGVNAQEITSGTETEYRIVESAVIGEATLLGDADQIEPLVEAMEEAIGGRIHAADVDWIESRPWRVAGALRGYSMRTEYERSRGYVWVRAVEGKDGEIEVSFEYLEVGK